MTATGIFPTTLRQAASLLPQTSVRQPYGNYPLVVKTLRILLVRAVEMLPTALDQKVGRANRMKRDVFRSSWRILYTNATTLEIVHDITGYANRMSFI